MGSGDLPLDTLFRALPLTRGLAGVRENVLACSTTNAGRRWTGSSAYATIGRRVVAAETLRSVFETAERRALEHVRRFHRLVCEALLALSSGEKSAGAFQELIARGEESAVNGEWDNCIEYFSAVETLSVEYDVVEASILARRRLGRAWLHLGDLRHAQQWYSLSISRAVQAADRAGVIIGHTGLGHILCVQGRWRDAEQEYTLALNATHEEDVLLRTQLDVDLSMTAREQGRLDEAEWWLASALRKWDMMSDGDRSGALNNQALLLMARGQNAEAEAVLYRALELSPSHFDSAMILDNLAEVRLRLGDLDGAETFARRAEEFGIAGAAPRALADIYLRLGRIMRMREDANGVYFFEQAIRLAQDNRYTFTEALVYAEYALFRRVTGDDEEAAALRETAIEIFRTIGTDPLPESVRG